MAIRITFDRTGGERGVSRGLLLLLGGLGLLAAMGGGGLALAGAASTHAGKAASGQAGRPADMGVLAPLPSLDLTLSDGNGFRQVELQVVLELDPAVDRTALPPHVTRIANAVSARMVDLDVRELSGPAGTQLVKQQVGLAANRELRPIKIRQVLLRRFLVH